MKSSPVVKRPTHRVQLSDVDALETAAALVRADRSTGQATKRRIAAVAHDLLSSIGAE